MRQPTRNSSHRPAFTLLEVLLATAIGIVLMGALYVTMNIQLRHAQAGRDAVEQSTLARALTARMANDITGNLGQATSSVTTQSAAQPSTTASSSSTTTASSTSSSSTASTSSSTTSSSSASTSSSTSVGAAGSANVCVQGDSTHLVLSVSRVSREFTLGPNSDTSTTNLVGISDLRLISYWLVGDSGSAQGLARMEYKPVTSTDAVNAIPPNLPDDASYVIAEEVKSLTFSYFDGSAWQDSWDGTTPGPDGVTPMGPPWPSLSSWGCRCRAHRTSRITGTSSPSRPRTTC